MGCFVPAGAPSPTGGIPATTAGGSALITAAKAYDNGFPAYEPLNIDKFYSLPKGPQGFYINCLGCDRRFRLQRSALLLAGMRAQIPRARASAGSDGRNRHGRTGKAAVRGMWGRNPTLAQWTGSFAIYTVLFTEMQRQNTPEGPK